MNTQRTAAEQTAAAHVCRSCTLPLVQPQDAEQTGRDWLVQLYCPSCGWSGEATLDQGQMDDLDEAVDDGFASLAATLAQVTRANMEGYLERFTAALAADAVLPEDF
jgi:Putative zinc ribbon domain